MVNEKPQTEKNYEDLKTTILKIVSETPNDMSLGIKMRLFAESLKSDTILSPEYLKGKTL